MPPTAPRGTVKEELKSLNMINDRTNGMDLSEIINITENAREASKSKNMNLSSISKQTSGQVDLSFYNPSGAQSLSKIKLNKKYNETAFYGNQSFNLDNMAAGFSMRSTANFPKPQTI